MFYLYLLVALVILLPVTAFVVFPWLAEENILFTTVKEGTIKAVMNGKSVHHFLMSFAGYHLNDPMKKRYDRSPDVGDWAVVPHPGHDDSEYDDRSWLLKYLGLYWVGWPWRASVFVYRFEWNETETNISTGKEKVRSRSELTDFIFVSDFTYAVVTDAAETNEGLPTDELTLVTIAIRNPYRALFSGEDWMRRITAAINRHVRDFVGNEEYSHLISTKIDKGDFSKAIIELNDKLPDDKDGKGLTSRYGVVIRMADLQTIELSGEAKKEHQEASTAKYTADRKAEAVIAEANAEAEATKVKGAATAGVIEVTGNKEAIALRARLDVIKEYGDAGITLAGYDAIQAASKNPGSQTIWANNPLGALAGLLKPEKKGGES